MRNLEDAPSMASRGIRIALVLEDADDHHRQLLSWLHHVFRHVIVIHPPGGSPVLGVTVRDFGGVLGLEFTNRLLLRRNRAVK